MVSGTGNERKTAAAYKRERRKRTRAREQGFVIVGWAAQWLKVDRQLLVKLYKQDVIRGKYFGNALWLDRSSLAAYCWSRPRCRAEGCHRRALLEGGVCSEHPRHRTQSAQEREMRSEAAQKRWGSELVRCVCEFCEREDWLLPSKAYDRFCSHEHLNEWIKRERAGKPLSDALDGHSQWLERKRREHAARGERTPAAVPKLIVDVYPGVSGATVGHWIRTGQLPSVPGPRSIDNMVEEKAALEFVADWVSGDDGRRQRWLDPKTHGDLVSARHGVDAARPVWGLCNSF